MDSNLVTALAAVGGALIGGVTSLATTVLAQRLQGRRERLSRELDKREALYSEFNQLASELMLESLDRQLDEPAKLVTLMAMIGRIRLIATDSVLAAAEFVLRELLASYQKPPAPPAEAILSNLDALTAPLIGFTQACRLEREAMLRRM
jgi:hypothetical protein